MAEKDDFWAWQRDLAPAPLAGPQGEAWWLLWGHVKDGWTEGAKGAVKARFPSTAAPDALGAQAVERGTERYPGEAEPAYRVRLAESFDRWKLGGTQQGLIDAMAAGDGVSSVGYYEAWQWDPHPDGGAGWRWARLWLVVRADWGTAPICGAPGVDCGPELLCGLTGVSLDQVDFLRRQRRRWKGAHVQAVIVLPLGGAVVCGEEGLVCGEPLVCGVGSVAYL